MLTSIQIVSHIGTNGVLSLEVPEGFSNTDVLVTVQPLALGTREAVADTTDWKTFLAETYGSCADLDEPEDLLPQQRDWS
jgi:hypothetical protein